MDKQLLKAYIRTIVEEEIQRVVPQMLSEAVSEIKKIKQLQENTGTSLPSKPKIERSRLAEMMGMTYDGETLNATTRAVPLPENAPRDVDPEVIKAVTKDYSAVMKKLGLT